MTAYSVLWEIDIDAASPQEAAEKARAIQERPDCAATVFDVQWHAGTESLSEQIDLDAIARDMATKEIAP